MAVYKTDDGTFVISSHQVWLPGCYDSERSARYAFRLPDKALYDLQQAKNAGDNSPISMNDLKAARAALKNVNG